MLPVNRRRLLLIAWLSLQALVVLWFLLSAAEDRQVLFLFALALSFPSGLVPMFVGGGIFYASHTLLAIDLGLSGNLVVWFGCIAAGYWQWFVVCAPPRSDPPMPAGGNAGADRNALSSRRAQG